MSLSTATKFAAAALALLAFTGASYRGDRASINFPDGWSGPENGEEGLVTFKESGGVANCNLQTKNVDDARYVSLDQINALEAHVYTVADWATLLGVSSSDLTVINSELRPFADAYFHIATLRVKYQGSEAMVRYGFYVLPGRISMAGCYARADDYPKYADLFDKTITSLRPW